MEVDKFIAQLERNFPQFRIRSGKKFMFKFPHEIRYESPEAGELNTEFAMQLLHEIGHGILEHKFLERTRSG